MRRLNRKRLPVLCLGGLVKVAEGFAAANSMIWRQSPSATTVEQNGGTRPLWVMRAGNQAGKRLSPRTAVYVAMGFWPARR
jgi:hypothetical protein